MKQDFIKLIKMIWRLSRVAVAMPVFIIFMLVCSFFLCIALGPKEAVEYLEKNN